MDEDGVRSRSIPDAHPFDNAIRAVRNKKPPPEMDFTLHTMEDGTQVNTTERVCKGKYSMCPCFSLKAVLPSVLL